MDWGSKIFLISERREWSLLESYWLSVYESSRCQRGRFFSSIVNNFIKLTTLQYLNKKHFYVNRKECLGWLWSIYHLSHECLIYYVCLLIWVDIKNITSEAMSKDFFQRNVDLMNDLRTEQFKVREYMQKGKYRMKQKFFNKGKKHYDFDLNSQQYFH